VNRPYLPSLQFSLIMLSLLGASGLVYAAQTLTAPSAPATITSTAPDSEASAAAVDHSNWQASLNEIQSEEGSSSLPAAPDPNTVNGLLQSVQSSNLTDTIGKSLLIKLTDAASQGLGPDAPTQDSIVQSALGQVSAAASLAQTYTQSDLIVVTDSSASQKAYGNALALAIENDKQNDYGNTMVVMDDATSQNNPDVLKKLQPLADDYRALVKNLLQIPVPQTMAPFHLQLVNNFARISETYEPMATVLSDPLQGLVAIQNYESLTQETAPIFTDIAQALSKDGILFNKDDPGSAWAGYLTLQQQNQ